MARRSVTKAHNKIQELSWEPTFVTKDPKYKTDYKLTKGGQKDAMKQVMQSYFPMQEEKDHRVYGAIDGAIRGNMWRQVQPRWMEWQKLFLSIIPFPEISAARAMPLLTEALPNPEIHNGLAFQMIDEVRHSTIQMNLKREYMRNYIDPAGFDITQKAFHNNYAGTIGRQFGEGFITGDAITACNIYLQVVAETAFTNTLFVAMPSEAAANGDYLLPTVFLSVQSDESRHMNNGYGTLLMALEHEENQELLERDLRYAWWNNHAVVDAAIGVFIDYGTKDRRKDRESYAEQWRRWVYDDYYRSYLVPLRGRGGGVDRRDVGAGVVGQVQRAVEHPRHAQVVDVVTIPEGQLAGLVLGTRCADASTEGRLERLALGDGLDGVEDLHVAGAAAEVGAEMRSHRRASRSAPFLSICALARTTIPGMQKPHCRPPQAANASAKRRRSSASMPSRVTTDEPATLASGRLQLTTALPSTSTVQHPHCPDGEHPSFGDVTSSSSRARRADGGGRGGRTPACR